MGFYVNRRTKLQREKIMSALVKPRVDIIKTKFLTTKEKELLEQIDRDYGVDRSLIRYRLFI